MAMSLFFSLRLRADPRFSHLNGRSFGTAHIFLDPQNARRTSDSATGHLYYLEFKVKRGKRSEYFPRA